jgi:hypothetical protein
MIDESRWLLRLLLLLLDLLLLVVGLLLLLIGGAGLGGLLAEGARPTSPAWVVSLLPAYSCCCHV